MTSSSHIMTIIVNRDEKKVHMRFGDSHEP